MYTIHNKYNYRYNIKVGIRNTYANGRNNAISPISNLVNESLSPILLSALALALALETTIFKASIGALRVVVGTIAC